MKETLVGLEDVAVVAVKTRRLEQRVLVDGVEFLPRIIGSDGGRLH